MGVQDTRIGGEIKMSIDKYKPFLTFHRSRITFKHFLIGPLFKDLHAVWEGRKILPHVGRKGFLQYIYSGLKGQCHEIFYLWFFS